MELQSFCYAPPCCRLDLSIYYVPDGTRSGGDVSAAEDSLADGDVLVLGQVNTFVKVSSVVLELDILGMGY